SARYVPASVAVRRSFLFLLPLLSRFDPAFLLRAQLVKYRVKCPAEDAVCQPEEKPEYEYRDNHDRCRGLHFLSRRRNDLLHLRTNVAQESSEILPDAERVSRHV